MSFSTTPVDYCIFTVYIYYIVKSIELYGILGL